MAIDEKRLNEIEAMRSDPVANIPMEWHEGNNKYEWTVLELADDLIRLARLGLWADKYGKRIMNAASAVDEIRFRAHDMGAHVQDLIIEARAALPKEPTGQNLIRKDD